MATRARLNGGNLIVGYRYVGDLRQAAGSDDCVVQLRGMTDNDFLKE